MHKFYLSVTLIEYKTDQNSLQVTSKLFLDDLEYAMNQIPGIKPFEIGNDSEPKNLEQLYVTYLKDHFKIVADNVKKDFVYIGNEIKGDQIVFYLEYENLQKPKMIQINNTLLVSAINEQQNLVHIKDGNKKKSILMDKKNIEINHKTQY